MSTDQQIHDPNLTDDIEDNLIQYPLIEDNSIMLFGDHIAVPVLDFPSLPPREEIDFELVMVEHQAYRVYPADLNTARKLQDFYAMRVDSAQGFNAPCMNHPDIEQPWEPQRITVDFMMKYKRGFVLNGTGTGKTRSTAWAGKALMDLGEVKRVLILSTLTTIDNAWSNDIPKAVPGARVEIAHGDAVTRRRVFEGDAPWVVSNHDVVSTKELVAAMGQFDMVVIDEIAHSFRTWMNGSEPTRSKRLNKLLNSELNPVPRVWGLTATPQSQGPYSVWNQARLVNSGYAKLESRTKFIDATMVAVGDGGKKVPRKMAGPLVAATLTPSIRIPHGFKGTYKPSLQETPPFRHHCSLSQQQQEAIDLALAENRIAANKEIADTGKISLPLRSQMVRTQMMIAAGALKIEHDDPEKPATVIRFDVTERLKKLVELISQPGKSIIYTSHTAPLEMLTDFFTQYHILRGGDPKKPDFAVIQGKVSRKRRSDILDMFQDKSSGLKYLIAQPITMAHGVTATAGNKTIWWGPAPHADAYIQGNYRTDRSGQTEKCTTHEIVSTDVEAKRFDGHWQRMGEQDLVLQLTDMII